MDAIVLRTDAGLNELEVVKSGTEIECLGYLADTILPSENTKNVKRLECDNGRMFSVEKKMFGQVVGGEWKEYKYLYLSFSEK